MPCLAGLETPDEGRITFGHHHVSNWAKKRSLGYPLKPRMLKGAETTNRATETAELFDCGRPLGRYRTQLRGGEQRVALARGLVARPDGVLFDEPLSKLDARARFSAVSVIPDQRWKWTESWSFLRAVERRVTATTTGEVGGRPDLSNTSAQIAVGA